MPLQQEGKKRFKCWFLKEIKHKRVNDSNFEFQTEKLKVVSAMNFNKYAIISLLLGLVLFFGTYFLAFVKHGWTILLTTMFYGGLLWLGFFFFLVGLLMLFL